MSIFDTRKTSKHTTNIAYDQNNRQRNRIKSERQKESEKSGNKNQKLLALIVHIFFCRFNDEIMHNDEIRRIDAFKKQPQNRANDCIDDEETDSRTSEVDE